VNDDTDRDIASLAWNITYTGGDASYDEGIAIAPVNSIFPTDQIKISANKADISGKYPLPISDLPPGTYKVRVTGRPSDVSSANATTQFTIPGDAPNPSIVIH
jgi:hypothetical protein